jgi:hypothetical protein
MNQKKTSKWFRVAHCDFGQQKELPAYCNYKNVAVDCTADFTNFKLFGFRKKILPCRIRRFCKLDSKLHPIYGHTTESYALWRRF